MNSRKTNVMWSISLLAIGIATIILAGTNILGIELSDVIVRILGIIDLVALPVLAFTTVKKFRTDE